MAQCFVIQPFDRGPFDKRYKDVFVPAIEAADLEPYRVDEDPGTVVLIEDIERGIRDSAICLAEITTDNPNIWYEVGFALASDRPVVLVCAAQRPTPFPFDVRHRSIITYSSDSPSDFTVLQEQITARLKGQIRRAADLRNIASISPIQETEGLTPHEIAALVTVMENRLTPDSATSVWQLRNEMVKAGFTEVAATLSVESLNRKKLLEIVQVADPNEGPYDAVQLTSAGVNWLLNNQELLILRRGGRKNSRPVGAEITDKDIPF